jgi:hypothetical protein
MQKNNNLLLKYAGLTMQLALSIAIMVFIGIKLDYWLVLKTGIFVWLLPLLIIVALIFKIIKDTAPKK